MDESFFLDFRAQGHGPMIQFTWIYDRDIDVDALRRFHHNLGKGLLSRCIERSPLPFGRARWVAWSPPDDFEVAQEVRPRREVAAWTDEQADLGISLESGPPWRLAVQPLAEGGAAITLVVAHAIADGVGVNNAVADAVRGRSNDLGYPSPHSRTKIRAVFDDARQLIRDLPRVLKGLALAPLAAREVPMRERAGLGMGIARHAKSRGYPALRGLRADRAPEARFPSLTRLPSLTVLIDIPQWDERAMRVGGTSNSLLIGLTSRICAILGWLDSDGLVNLAIPVNERKPGDFRGNALTTVLLTVDPSAATDLRVIRATVRAGLARLNESRNRIMAPLALIPFVPKFVANRFQAILQGSANVTCSHFGDLDPEVNCPDGTEADVFYARHARTMEMADPALLQRAGGLFFPVASGRLGGRIYISICYADAEGATTREQLTAVVLRALDDFELTAVIE